MWRMPKLVVEDVDNLVEMPMINLSSHSPSTTPPPVPVPTPIPPPVLPPTCTIERCWYGKSCDIFPVL